MTVARASPSAPPPPSPRATAATRRACRADDGARALDLALSGKHALAAWTLLCWGAEALPPWERDPDTHRVPMVVIEPRHTRDAVALAALCGGAW
jgi:hypothetical protein